MTDPTEPNRNPTDDLDPLTEEALAWQVRLHSGSRTEETRRAFDAWRREDPAHARAADRAAALWELLGPALAPRGTGPRNAAVAAIVFGLSAAAVGAGLFGPPRAWIADVGTAVGERRSVTLGDGSKVDLDGGTSFDVAFTPGLRRLTLHTGRIHVAVRADPARPFEVVGDGGTTRALGTAFDVAREGERTRVLVTEHAVRLTAPRADPEAAIDVREGQEASYTEAGLGEVRTVDAAVRSAWRHGLLVFDGRPLAEVVAALERYRRGRVLILDPDLGRLRVTGSFAPSDTDRMLDALQAALPIRIRRLPLLTVIQADPDRRGGK